MKMLRAFIVRFYFKLFLKTFTYQLSFNGPSAIENQLVYCVPFSQVSETNAEISQQKSSRLIMPRYTTMPGFLKTVSFGQV